VADAVQKRDNLFANVRMEMHYKSTKKVDNIKKNPLLSGDKRVYSLVEARGIEPLCKVYKVAIIA
jgi:hypothetical protein